MLTTVALRVGQRQVINKTKLTTLPSQRVYRYLKAMNAAGVTDAVIEMTSHALDQHRLAGLTLAGAIILNVEREHLDYHQTMEKYALAKERILHYLPAGAPLVGKEDDKYVAGILERARQRGLSIHPFTAEQARQVVTALSGTFNKENALAASLLARALKIPEHSIQAGVGAVTAVPGRMQWINNDKGFRILIDYAVTPAALRRVYQEVRPLTVGRILGVLGAAGLRDRGKRPLMARAVAGQADLLVITREDPWTESEQQIFSDLEEGLKETTIHWRRITDRKEAIQYLLREAKPGDTVVITGKGAEVGMGIGKKIIPWNDAKVVEEILREL